MLEAIKLTNLIWFWEQGSDTCHSCEARPDSQLSAQQVLRNRESRLSDTEMEIKPRMPTDIY